MDRVLLISMPFASTRYPSPALSLLKSLLQQEGIACDVAYLNILFQAFCGRPDVYEGIADFLMVGEWVFGGDLFGETWARSDRGAIDHLEAPLFPAGSVRSRIQETLVQLRSMAAPFLENCIQNIPWERYRVVGFTSVFSQQIASLALARRIKDRWPDKTIVFGGANCQDKMGAALLRLFPFVDWVCNGEADISFPQAVRRLAEDGSYDDIQGLYFRRNGKVAGNGSGASPDLNDLPYPDFAEYFQGLKRWAPDFLPDAPVSLELSRGCWWGNRSQCVFCGLNCKSLKYRRKRGERAEAEIRRLTETHGVDKVMLADSILDMSYFKTLLPGLAAWGGLGELFVETRSNLNCEQVGLLKAAGVQALQPGIESLDTEMLQYMNKGTTLLETVQFLKCARQWGIFPAWNLLYGFPGENPQAYRRIHALIPSVCHLSPPMDLSPVLLVRFSPLYSQSRKWGLENLRAHRGYGAIYPFDPSDLDDLGYFFEADFPGAEEIPSYIEPLRRQVAAWKNAWRQTPGPGLTYEIGSGNRVLIFDTRPGSGDGPVVLEDDGAIAYLLCETAQSFDELAAALAGQRGPAYAGDEALEQCLADLITKRLMLQEKDRYLSLAVKPVRSMEVSEDW